MSAEMPGGRTMEANAGDLGERQGNGWRTARWAAIGLILVAPLVAMQFTNEVNWDVADFALAGALLVGVNVLYELASRLTGDTVYRAAVGVALAAALLLVWVNGAVGIIGSENNEANLMYGGVLAVGIVGAILSRFRPHGMARAMYAAAVTQALVAAIALIGGLGGPESGPVEIVALNGFFIALFAGSASLFQKAASRHR